MNREVAFQVVAASFGYEVEFTSEHAPSTDSPTPHEPDSLEVPEKTLPATTQIKVKPSGNPTVPTVLYKADKTTCDELVALVLRRDVKFETVKARFKKKGKPWSTMNMSSRKSLGEDAMKACDT